MSTLWLDLETFSEIPIKNGVHAYAEKSEVLLFAWAMDDEPAQVWDATFDEIVPKRLKHALLNPDVLVYAHNSNFDRTILRHVMPQLCPPIERWRDTMVKAMAHSLPGSLGQLCEILGIEADQSKDKDGKKLIHLFCKPQPKTSKIRRATRETHPEEWERFKSYAGRDIDAMRAIDKKLPTWNYSGDELALWHLDQKINDRGFAVDVDLANAAIRAVNQAQAKLADRTNESTNGDVQTATQRDAMLAHILSEYGVTLPDMQKSTIERRVNDEDLPLALRELLAIRLQSATSSTAKFKKLIECVSSDARLRSTLQFCGAGRTGRWSGRLVQPQNFMRGTLKNESLTTAIEALKLGIEDLIYE